MIHDFVDSGHMNKENRELVKRTILSQHRHNNSLGNSGMRKKSTISDFFLIVVDDNPHIQMITHLYLRIIVMPLAVRILPFNVAI